MSVRLRGYGYPQTDVQVMLWARAPLVRVTSSRNFFQTASLGSMFSGLSIGFMGSLPLIDDEEACSKWVQQQSQQARDHRPKESDDFRTALCTKYNQRRVTGNARRGSLAPRAASHLGIISRQFLT